VEHVLTLLHSGVKICTKMVCLAQALNRLEDVT